MPMEQIGFMLQGRLFDPALNRKSQGHILFGIVNGQCVDNLKSKASDVNSSSLPGLDIATNRDIIGIYLANLIASLKTLAIMASEKRLILQPHNWALRRDHDMMLEYREVVQELSICMALAPKEEAEILEPFVEKLHLLRLKSSWKSLGHKGLSAAINSDLMAEELKRYRFLASYSFFGNRTERTVELMRLERKKSASSSDVHEIKDNEIENSSAAEIYGIRDQKPEIAMEQRKESPQSQCPVLRMHQYTKLLASQLE
ncbi:hypothetical protein L1987_49335 [Smallanthus sonchifolius]|uniref:Uncharacterized protein n=1 Tax=Smallanthus sonchifolius TaxID=185202 RepID=A0ACB9FTU5_9ASTR|nr:hypothetical protein L1987_49335 [Smallanthus sonchifolius]